MFSKLINFAPLVLLGSSVLAAPGVALVQHEALAPRACFATETPARLCYTAPKNDPQDVLLDDVKFIASYLRSYGAQTRAGRLFNMAAADAPDCGEWVVYSHGTAQAFAKHINNTANSSVMFADIATTIDGGPNATPAQLATSLIGCGTDGGSLGVLVNATHPTYKGSTFPAGYTTGGIVIKIVSTGL